ncbi:uncharacterized protein LOC143214797 isoform X1 [Lasioglossum baleicum]|uniref:uncharacterized protein LOC143214797 isoform X1 n=1 Tax=Lasioglossum baleicum TaxID=434251 RepID=UPI003FCE50EA
MSLRQKKPSIAEIESQRVVNSSKGKIISSWPISKIKQKRSHQLCHHHFLQSSPNVLQEEAAWFLFSADLEVSEYWKFVADFENKTEAVTSIMSPPFSTIVPNVLQEEAAWFFFSADLEVSEYRVLCETSSTISRVQDLPLQDQT